MPIIIECPSCSRKVRVPEDLLGKLVKCPTCGNTFTATDPNKVEEPPPPAPAAEEDDEPSWEKKVKETPPIPMQEEDEEEEAPRRRKRRRRRRDEDDDDDDDYAGRRYQQPHRGALILTLGILSIFMFQIILGPIAWIMGNNDMAAIRSGRMDREGEGMTNAGRICGMIATILGIVCCCGYGLLFMVAGVNGPHGRF